MSRVCGKTGGRVAPARSHLFRLLAGNAERENCDAREHGRDRQFRVKRDGEVSDSNRNRTEWAVPFPFGFAGIAEGERFRVGVSQSESRSRSASTLLASRASASVDLF